MKAGNKKQNDRKGKVATTDETFYDRLDPSEVKQYEKGRIKRGARFGKKWFPENKKD